MPDELLEKIKDYIRKLNKSIEFNELFNAFATEFVANGIPNQYFLKSVLDDCMDQTEFVTTQHYVQYMNAKTPNQERMDFVNKQTGPFTFKAFCDAFPKTKPYVVYNTVHYDKDIIFLDSYTFVDAKYVGVTDEAKKYISDLLAGILDKNRKNVISISNFCGIVSVKNYAIWAQLGMIKSSYALFSYLQWAFSNFYHFRRPFISNEEIKGTNAVDLTTEYVKGLDSFSFDDVKSYSERTGTRIPASYLDFMKEMSDQYVQFSRGSMVKKNVINISQITLNDIKDTINLILKTNGEINGELFRNYRVFPQIPGYSWNEFLLVGIVRSYFEFDYLIEETSIYYVSTHYVIKPMDSSLLNNKQEKEGILCQKQ
jgi:hypothetical protein